MDLERELQFYRLYEQLSSLTQIVNQKPDISRIESLLNEIAAMFRLSKGVTNFYRNSQDERNGIGETMVSYDTGKAGKPVHTVRFVTRLQAVTTMTVYMTEDEVPLTEKELFKVDLTMRTAIAFISRNRLQDMVEEFVYYDDLGIYNIRSLIKYLSAKSKPDDLVGMSAIGYNLKHFALVNEEYGRKAGDCVLRNHYYAVMKIIGEDGIAVRLGKDDFVCICRTSELDRLIDFFKEADIPYDENGNTIPVSSYAGILNMTEGFVMRAPSDIMSRIMYTEEAARNGSHGSIVFFSETIMADKEHSKRIHKMLPKSIKIGEICAFFQPKVNINTGELVGAEALCRWFHNGEIIPPNKFIPILEETNEICQLDFYILELVCRYIRKWLDEGRKVVRVSVNLSRRHMTNPDLLDNIIEIIDRYNVPHEYIEIELVETTTDVEFKDLKRVVEGLQRQNIVTSVDDFGMGYSSLNLLRIVPWNTMKIDRIFLPKDDENDSSKRSVMLRFIVSLASELGFECIAEGVETTAQLALLREHNCELVQGYLFDKPLPVEEFEKRLDKEKYDIKFDM